MQLQTMLRFRAGWAKAEGPKHEVVLTYITGRGAWYHTCWKGMEEKSGGIATNIGIHLFDLLLWLFGKVQSQEVHIRNAQRMSCALEL